MSPIKTEFVLCFGVFVDSTEEGGTLLNVFMRLFFDVFRQSSRFNFRRSKQSSFYVFGVFIVIVGGWGEWEPGKCIPEKMLLP